VTELLEKAFNKAAELSSQEQDNLANWILEMLESDTEWDSLFERSADSLADLADEALSEFHAGQTEELDPDQL
jgi:hypothetical protein